jgi:hypothetical protein
MTVAVATTPEPGGSRRAGSVARRLRRGVETLAEILTTGGEMLVAQRA